MVQTAFMQTLDVMIEQGWVVGRMDPKRPHLKMSNDGNRHIRLSAETDRALAEAGRAGIVKDNLAAPTDTG